MTLINHHPDTAPVLPIKFRYLDRFLASRQLVPRHCASAIYYTTIRWQLTCFLSALYRDTRIRQAICTRTPKTAPWPPCTVTVLWLRWRGVTGPYPDASSGNTTSPYCRAVRFHARRHQTKESLRNFIMTEYFRPSIRTLPPTKFHLTWPAWPTLLANDNSRFCFDNLQNRFMSIICKSCPRTQAFILIIYRE